MLSGEPVNSSCRTSSFIAACCVGQLTVLLTVVARPTYRRSAAKARGSARPAASSVATPCWTASPSGNALAENPDQALEFSLVVVGFRPVVVDVLDVRSERQLKCREQQISIRGSEQGNDFLRQERSNRVERAPVHLPHQTGSGVCGCSDRVAKPPGRFRKLWPYSRREDRRVTSSVAEGAMLLTSPQPRTPKCSTAVSSTSNTREASPRTASNTAGTAERGSLARNSRRTSDSHSSANAATSARTESGYVSLEASLRMQVAQAMRTATSGSVGVGNSSLVGMEA